MGLIRMDNLSLQIYWSEFVGDISDTDQTGSEFLGREASLNKD